MVLAKAFIERNRLKKFIADLGAEISGMSFYHNELAGDVDWNETPLKGKTLNEAISDLLEAKHVLGLFNTEIDKANIKEAKALINRIETLKSSLSSVQGCLQRVNAIHVKEIMISDDGTQYTRTNVIDVDRQKLIATEKMIKKDINKIEDELATVNATTEVEISKEVQDYLDNYNN